MLRALIDWLVVSGFAFGSHTCYIVHQIFNTNIHSPKLVFMAVLTDIFGLFIVNNLSTLCMYTWFVNAFESNIGFTSNMCFMDNIFYSLYWFRVRLPGNDVPIYSETMHAADRIEITYAICWSVHTDTEISITLAWRYEIYLSSSLHKPSSHQ